MSNKYENEQRTGKIYLDLIQQVRLLSRPLLDAVAEFVKFTQFLLNRLLEHMRLDVRPALKTSCFTHNTGPYIVSICEALSTDSKLRTRIPIIVEGL